MSFIAIILIALLLFWWLGSFALRLAGAVWNADETGCPRCGVVAIGRGRRRIEAADAPCFGLPVLLVWLKRIWRCAEQDCPRSACHRVSVRVG